MPTDICSFLSSTESPLSYYKKRQMQSMNQSKSQANKEIQIENIKKEV